MGSQVVLVAVFQVDHVINGALRLRVYIVTDQCHEFVLMQFRFDTLAE